MSDEHTENDKREGTPPPKYAFQISLGELQALSLFQADETRLNLARTLFEIVTLPSGHVELTAAATNGRSLLSYRREVMPSELFDQIPETDRFAVDLTECRALPKTKAPDSVAVEVYATHVDFAAGSLRYTARREAQFDDGFPPWRSVIPVSAPNPAAFAVNSAYLRDFGKAAKLIADTEILMLQPYGADRPISVQVSKNAGYYGIVMPCLVETWPECPEWLKPAPKSKQPASDEDDE